MTRHDDALQQEERRRRSKRLRLIIVFSLLLFALLTYIEGKIYTLGEVPFPVSGNVLVFVLINVNVLLLLLMIFLVLRNLVQLVFERKRRILGTKLRTKLVISFVSLSLIPTGLLFFVSLQFVSTSMDYWFNTNVEQSLLESLDLARAVYRDAEEKALRQGERLAVVIEKNDGGSAVKGVMTDAADNFDLAGIHLFTSRKTQAAAVERLDVRSGLFPDVPGDLFRRVFAGESGITVIQSVSGGELVRGLVPVIREEGGETSHALVVSVFIPREKLDRMEIISTGLEGYRQLMLLKAPIKTSVLVMLLIVTLLIVFCAIWFGFYVAGGLTGPIGRLAEATRRVAEGELDFVLEKTSGDEMGTLVDSFNQMTRDLLISRRQIEMGSQELENRRRYIEIILQNVAAGVISIDEAGKVTMVNRYAEDLLRINRSEVVGRDYTSILRSEHLAILESFLADLYRSEKNSIQLPLRLTIGEETFSLRINFTKIEDDEHNPLGVVMVFDNLTELEKAQRMAAWREVARRIAHEVKNPLTPIQLSAQRLRKKYLNTIASEDGVFDACTNTIISQVDELKRLVSEFSEYARMPVIQKTSADLAAMVREIVPLYQEAHKQVQFRVIESSPAPSLLFDAKQMKRVLINLLDNGVAVLPEGGVIEIEIGVDSERGVAFFEVRDNGPGVRDADKPRLFEPYFSTKKSGTGLGLAIAATIVTDHGGTIRVRDNIPAGARFLVEIPLACE